ncbi:hypothetical protein NDU88_008287 [Pleurodeles waltl]|uniref:Uncharacterized protein n=1 Tax=Pleurodeles waltl TaxID=8319 RepID=A0AAV7PNQ5_PLEWA|nr:hypothetical protein NDU88_008287 [Pleurodeles waltl]
MRGVDRDAMKMVLHGKCLKVTYGMKQQLSRSLDTLEQRLGTLKTTVVELPQTLFEWKECKRELLETWDRLDKFVHTKYRQDSQDLLCDYLSVAALLVSCQKENSLKDLFSMTPATKTCPPGALAVEGGEATDRGPPEGSEALITNAFMEQLFGALHEDFATLQQEKAAEVKYLKRDVADLGQCVDTLEEMHNAHKHELDCHRRELLTLQDKNQDLQHQLEDLENRSHHSNFRIKGVPVQAVTGYQKDFVVCS